MSMTRFSCFAALAAAAALCQPAPLASAQPLATRPNILYIMSDDQGWKDVGFHGSDIKTPTLDRLAAQGATFNQFYSQAMCTPSRAALMTGRYPHRYAAMTTAMDEQIGRVVAELEKKGMRDNTLIVFQSDNGGPRSAKFTGE